MLERDPLRITNQDRYTRRSFLRVFTLNFFWGEQVLVGPVQILLESRGIPGCYALGGFLDQRLGQALFYDHGDERGAQSTCIRRSLVLFGD